MQIYSDASALAKKCMSVYQTFVGSMNQNIQRAVATNNPFVFKHISNLKVGYCMGILYLMHTVVDRKLRRHGRVRRSRLARYAPIRTESTIVRIVVHGPEEWMRGRWVLC